jgi:hypothetical protein
MQEGVLIAADEAAEYLIPWWWNHYSRSNHRPVAIVDFGMSEKSKTWCLKQQILVIPFEESFVVEPKENITSDRVKEWTGRYRGALWRSREAWFKKPAACLLSPFELTLWVDLDAEVCQSLDSLFGEWKEGLELAIVRGEPWFSQYQIFNSGVFLFHQKSPFLNKWNQLCQEQSEVVMGDQDFLTELILEGKIAFKELSPLYNWLMYAGFRPGIVIAHWVAGWGKEYIKKFGGLQLLLEERKKPCH